MHVYLCCKEISWITPFKRYIISLTSQPPLLQRPSSLFILMVIVYPTNRKRYVLRFSTQRLHFNLAELIYEHNCYH